jgi:hypothetical protein
MTFFFLVHGTSCKGNLEKSTIALSVTKLNGVVGHPVLGYYTACDERLGRVVHYRPPSFDSPAKRMRFLRVSEWQTHPIALFALFGLGCLKLAPTMEKNHGSSQKTAKKSCREGHASCRVEAPSFGGWLSRQPSKHLKPVNQENRDNFLRLALL